MTDLDVRLADGVLTLTMNRPAVLNAMTGEMNLALSGQLERAASESDASTVVATLQDVRYLTPRLCRAYADLSAQNRRVELFARGLQVWVAPGVPGFDVEDADPLGDEWALVCDGLAGFVFAARDRGRDRHDDLDTRFDYVLSRDASQVSACLDLVASRSVALRR